MTTVDVETAVKAHNESMMLQSAWDKLHGTFDTPLRTRNIFDTISVVKKENPSLYKKIISNKKVIFNGSEWVPSMPDLLNSSSVDQTNIMLAEQKQKQELESESEEEDAEKWVDNICNYQDATIHNKANEYDCDYFIKFVEEYKKNAESILDVHYLQNVNEIKNQLTNKDTVTLSIPLRVSDEDVINYYTAKKFKQVCIFNKNVIFSIV